MFIQICMKCVFKTGIILNNMNMWFIDMSFASSVKTLWIF